ncbi:MAG: MFS transporter [Chloroflexi bacterium]|nr:MFS transporter [Chloroflexota bacterium]
MSEEPRAEANNEAAPAQAAGRSQGYLQLFLSLHLPAVAIGLGTGMATPVLPLFAKSFDVSVGVAALVFVATMAGGFAASLPAGYAIDRFGRRKVLLAGPVIAAGAAFLVATSDSFTQLLIYRFIGGWGQQMWTVSRLTVIADTGSDRSRARQITSMFGIQRAGMLSGPLAGGLLAAAFGLRVPFVVQGVVTLLAVIPSFFVVRETAPGRSAAAGPRADAAPEQQEYSWRSLLRPPIPALFSAQYLATTARGATLGGGVLFLFAAYAYDSGPAELGILSSAMAVVGIPITLAAGYLMDRFGRMVTIVPGQALMGAGMVFLAVVAIAPLSFTAFVIGFVWVHVVNSMLSGSMQVLGSDIAPAHARGRFFGAGRMVSQAGFMSAPLSFAVLTGISGFGAAFFFLAGAGGVSALLLAFVVKETLAKR